METVQDFVRDALEEDGDQDVLDFVSEGEGDDLDSLEPPIYLDESFPATVVICNVPKVGQAKYQKLMGVLGKLIDKYGPNEKDMPFNEETEQTEGFVIVTFEQQEAADNAVVQLDGMNLDKAHTFKVVKMDKFDEIVRRQDRFEPQRTLTTFSRADFRDWLGDKKCREQILLRYQSETEIRWHDTMAGEPVLCYGGEREKRQKKVWCDWRVMWSPEGSYVATFHQQGIALWAGPDFTKKVRLPHSNVKEINFSPNEEYVLLWNGSHHEEHDDNAVRIYHVLTGQIVRKCRTPPCTPNGEDFPHFLWSKDGKFIAECNESRIMVRDTDSWEIIKDEAGKRTALKFDSLKNFQWSPKDNVLAVWTTEKDNNPARLTLVEIPSRREIASRSRTQCEAEMHWQSEGDYLCLLVNKLSKTKKRLSTNLEIFRIREKSIPVDIVTIEDNVRGFFWESKGSRFAILTADEAGHKPKLLIYQLGREKCEALCCFDLPSNSFNKVVWAPEGQYFVVASVTSATGASGSGDLLFAGLTADNKLEILHKDEHYMLTNVEWDPSSRYIITAVTQPMSNEGGYKYSMEAGYAIWTFQGRVLFRQQKEKLYGVSWRPHPPSLLPAVRQKDIRKNIKQFSKKYDAMDEQAKESARQAFRRERQEKTDAFLEVLDRLRDFKDERMAENGWDEALADFAEAQGWTQDDQIIEEELGVTEELISG
mmetsp:Transcript_25397/g.67481  ORF Transcript_25397/g.67481 Transcript_25397/m.67481 type:complete len:707 (-) Transcript_25397:283-2403(-)